MKLYTHTAATMCRPVHLYAADAGIALESVFVDLFEDAHRRPWFIAVNPSGAARAPAAPRSGRFHPP